MKDMRRFIAALVGCTMIAGAFVSCGNADGSSGTSQSAEAEASYCGKWELGTDKYINIGSDGKIELEALMSTERLFTFNSDGSGTLAGVEFGPGQFDYDGEIYRLHFSSDDDMKLRRLEPNDGTEFYGEYRLESGLVYDNIVKGYNDRSAAKGGSTTFDDDDIVLDLDISEAGTNLVVRFVAGEALPDGQISFNIGGETYKGTYSVDGDVMTINTDSGNTKELKRVK